MRFCLVFSCMAWLTNALVCTMECCISQVHAWYIGIHVYIYIYKQLCVSAWHLWSWVWFTGETFHHRLALEQERRLATVLVVLLAWVTATDVQSDVLSCKLSMCVLFFNLALLSGISFSWRQDQVCLLSATVHVKQPMLIVLNVLGTNFVNDMLCRWQAAVPKHHLEMLEFN